jgi:hypothetical protein
VQQAVDIVITYLRDHPEQHQYPAWYGGRTVLGPARAEASVARISPRRRLWFVVALLRSSLAPPEAAGLLRSAPRSTASEELSDHPAAQGRRDVAWANVRFRGAGSTDRRNTF